METGIVFDISHYMIEDGPGIRTSVFMKGCPLRCQWCSNAYGLKAPIELGQLSGKCSSCGACMAVCSQGAIRISREEKRSVTDFAKCQNCFACVDVCTNHARIRIGKKMTTQEALQEVEKDRIFYRRGDGGVTISGGEILMQPAFVIELLQKCRDAYINTAIETSGYGNWEDLSQMIACSDTVFIDCKCMEHGKHRALTGVSNERILENIQKAAAQVQTQGNQLVIRLPLIPGKNDDDENLKATAAFVRALAGSPMLNILPYHNYGMNKYETIGMRYQLEAVQLHTKEDKRRIEEVLRATGVSFSIGGYQM